MALEAGLEDQRQAFGPDQYEGEEERLGSLRADEQREDDYEGERHEDPGASERRHCLEGGREARGRPVVKPAGDPLIDLDQRVAGEEVLGEDAEGPQPAEEEQGGHEHSLAARDRATGPRDESERGIAHITSSATLA